MIFEGLNCGFRAMTREHLTRMDRRELVEWLEFRGVACYSDESTSSLRDCAIEDFGDESLGEECH